jgi:hypothetical protein
LYKTPHHVARPAAFKHAAQRFSSPLHRHASPPGDATTMSDDESQLDDTALIRAVLSNLNRQDEQTAASAARRLSPDKLASFLKLVNAAPADESAPRAQRAQPAQSAESAPSAQLV